MYANGMAATTPYGIQSTEIIGRFFSNLFMTSPTGGTCGINETELTLISRTMPKQSVVKESKQVETTSPTVTRMRLFSAASAQHVVGPGGSSSIGVCCVPQMVAMIMSRATKHSIGYVNRILFQNV